MSAIANSPVTPDPAPEASKLKPAAGPHTPKSSSRKWIILVLLVLVAAAAWMARPRQEQKNVATASIRTVTVTNGTLERVMRLTGTTAAGNFANITMPMLRGPDSGRNLTLIQLATSGTMVKKGDVVAQIDGQSQQDHIDDVQAMIDGAEADIRKTKAEQAIELETLRQTVRVSKATLDKIKLDSQAVEIRTVIDQEQIKLSLEEAQAQYNELLKDFETVVLRQKSQQRLMELARDKHVRHKGRHLTDLERFTIHTPMAGLVVMQSVWRGGDMGQVQLGDQVSPGQPFMKIVDTGSMLMNAAVNQAESESIRIGQTATIGFDAFPGLIVNGKVVAVGAMAIGGWRQNYYIRSVPVRVSLVGQDPRVIPDLSAAADVVIGGEAEALMVPREAVHEVAGKIVVYVKQASGFAAREVKLGIRNNVQVAVASGLKAGDVVALQPPDAGVVAR